MAKQDYERDWDNLPIKYLILSSKGRYCVFIDPENDLDWKTADAFDADELNKETIRAFNQVKNEIDSVESIPCSHLEEKVIITFKRQVGEALVRALERDFESANKMIQAAREYISGRNTEESRFMYLTSSGVTALAFVIVGLILWLTRGSILNYLGETPFFLMLAAIAGAPGAFLSITLRIGKTNLDCNASRKLHYLEGSTKIIAGVISGWLIGLCIKTGIILPIFSEIASTHIAMILGGVIAGSSERLVPSIINKFEVIEKSKEK